MAMIREGTMQLAVPHKEFWNLLREITFIYTSLPLVSRTLGLPQVEGFRAGVQKASLQASVTVGKVPDFNDVSTAVRITREMIAQGVDVIYTTGDSFNLAVITEAQRAKVFTIGYIADQRYIAPDYVLASMVQDVGQCYRIILEQFTQNRLPSGKVMYGLEEGVNQLSPYGPMVPQKVREEIDGELKQLLQYPVPFGG